MRIFKLHKVTGFWKSLSFKSNICKIRKALSNYLTEEGIDNRIEDGLVVFKFDDSHFLVEFKIEDDYPECIITYQIEDQDYESLDVSDKTYIADKVNTDNQNHCVVYTFSDSIILKTTFYFTNRQMMLDLFSQHFVELTENRNLTLNIAQQKIDEHKELGERRIGFNVDITNQQKQQSEEEKVVAKA